MFIVFIHISSIYQSSIKMLRKVSCHCNQNAKDCFYTVEDVPI